MALSGSTTVPCPTCGDRVTLDLRTARVEGDQLVMTFDMAPLVAHYMDRVSHLDHLPVTADPWAEQP